MQHIPDKEFDNLFRDKFKDAEITPSANLWANIEKELAPKKKRSFPIYWMAAASVAIAITAMLVFQEKKVIKLHGTDQTASAGPKAIDTIAIPNATAVRVEPVRKMVAKTQVPTVKEQTRQAVAPVNNPVENNQQKNQLAVQPNPNTNRLPIKQQDPRPIDVLPIKEAQVENQAVIAQAPTSSKVEDNVINEGSAERKGIRNVGDLVNYVVDKVDKRDKKLVRFNTDDDDNSSIIGINIGFLKFNKKNKEQR